MKKFNVRKNNYGRLEITFSGEDYRTKEKIFSSVPVTFAKGIEPTSSKQTICVNDDDYYIFPNVYVTRDGVRHESVRFHIKGWYPAEQNQGNVINIGSDDLPF